MRRNHENTNGIVSSNHYHLKELKETAAVQGAEIRAIFEHVKKESFQKDMDAPDIGIFFPVKEPKQLELFMDRSHPEWDARRKEFYNMLFTCLTKQKNSFSKGIIGLLFSREYICNVKWPTFG